MIRLKREVREKRFSLEREEKGVLMNMETG